MTLFNYLYCIEPTRVLGLQQWIYNSYYTSYLYHNCKFNFGVVFSLLGGIPALRVSVAVKSA